MKRKHVDAVDQVDAIGIRVDEMSFDEIGIAPHGMAQMCNTFRKLSFDKKSIPDNNVAASSSLPLTEPKTDPLKNHTEYGKPGNPLAQKDNDTVGYYTVRITERQMQEFLDQNRIYAKDGSFYLK